MRYAILADIHANLEALETVLRDAQDQGVTHHVCLGDVVGYNPNPCECVELVRSLGMPCVKGNHDEYCADNIPIEDFNPHAASAVLWTRRQLSDADRLWLRELPYVQAVQDFTIVHATLDNPPEWRYVLDMSALMDSLACQETPVCFTGHTHLPLAFVMDQEVRGGNYTRFKVEPGRKYFVNPGSVGQPRDGNPLAAYAIYDMDAQTIELRRLEYDLAITQAKILAAGLPELLAERLAYGK
jgi:diadenosine tetraphosphatase ApaH/serine/threonine PP2A family protein phosphatase